MRYILVLVYSLSGEQGQIQYDPMNPFPSLESCLAFALREDTKIVATILRRENGWDSAEFGCMPVKGEVET